MGWDIAKNSFMGAPSISAKDLDLDKTSTRNRKSHQVSAAMSGMTDEAKSDGKHSVVLRGYSDRYGDVLKLSGDHNLKAGDKVTLISNQGAQMKTLGPYEVTFAD